MRTILATTTAMLVAAAAPALAGDQDKSDMVDTAATMTMDAKMQKKQAMDMKTTNMMAAKYATDGGPFDMIDTNADGQVDFTEFSTFMETKGYDATDSAKEYVKLTGGSSDVITDRTFAGVDIANMPHKHLDDGTVHNMDDTQSAAMGMTTTMTTEPVMTTQPSAVLGSTITTDSMTVSSPVSLSYSNDYGVFGDYDMNSDGRVDFNEYRKARSKTGITTTAAAQEFIRFTNGQSDFDEIRFQIAASEDVLNRGYFRSEPRL